jgi:hypothetical protein
MKTLSYKDKADAYRLAANILENGLNMNLITVATFPHLKDFVKNSVVMDLRHKAGVLDRLHDGAEKVKQGVSSGAE